MATAETVEQRFAEAAAVKAQLDDLVAALGAAAERAARELTEEPFEPPSARGPVDVQDVRRAVPPRRPFS